MLYYVTIEFEFESDTVDTLDFTEEVVAVIDGIQFVDRFDSATRCVDYAITEVNT